MSFKTRQYHQGFWYHVYARGIDENKLFGSDKDRKWFIKKTDEIFFRNKIKLGALSLMHTHYHMLVKMGPVSLSKALQSLHMSYAKYVNNTRKRRGPVFCARPGVKIILNDVYLIQLVPYIHKNAVKAGIVKTAQEYQWHTDELYRKGSWKHEKLRCWEFPPFFNGKNRRLVYEERMEEKTVFPENVPEYIGRQDEWEKLERRNQNRSNHFRERRGRLSMKEIAEAKVNEAGITLQDLKEPGRRQAFVGIRQKAMAEMYAEGFGPSEIGKYFNRSKGSVVNAVNKYNK